MRTPAELVSDGWRALVKEVGLADAVRYRVLFQFGVGNYVKERKALFEKMTMDVWLRELERWEKARRNP